MDSIGPPTLTITGMIDACIKLASWTAKHKDEIRQLYNKGYRSAQKIVEILTKRYKKK